MSPEFESDIEKTQADDTLRLMAQLPGPAGLEERIHRRLRAEQAAGNPRGFWSLWRPAHRLQFAAAALLVAAVATSTVMVRHPHSGTPAAAGPMVPQVITTPGNSFGSAGAERHPSTLTPILVPAPKKKPGAGRAARHAAKPEKPSPAQQPDANSPTGP